jgi:hypothetical protein
MLLRSGRRSTPTTPLVFVSPFDMNGVLFHIATAAGTKQYSNPQMSQAVGVTVSSTPFGLALLEHFVEHEHAHPVLCGLVRDIGPPPHVIPWWAYPWLAYDANHLWFAVDLGPTNRLIPRHYCLRSDDSSAVLRNWELQGASSGHTLLGLSSGLSWVTLRKHQDDTSLSTSSMSVAAWPIAHSDCDGYRHFRILMTGPNSKGGRRLSCAGIELYGCLRDLR